MFVSNTETIDELMEVLKGDLKAYLIERIRKFDPELQQHITKKLINECLIYIKGYSSALKENISLPINKRDMQLFLLERAYEYARGEILGK